MKKLILLLCMSTSSVMRATVVVARGEVEVSHSYRVSLYDDKGCNIGTCICHQWNSDKFEFIKNTLFQPMIFPVCHFQILCSSVVGNGIMCNPLAIH